MLLRALSSTLVRAIFSVACTTVALEAKNRKTAAIFQDGRRSTARIFGDF